MGSNKLLYEKGEANKWFQRNKEKIENNHDDKICKMLVEWLNPFSDEISEILEIGCGTGHRLKNISHSLSAKAFGLDPSEQAIKYMKNKFPNIVAKRGFGDDVPFTQRFDLVHLGFFLYLVDRELYLRCISEADRLLRFGGFLSIIDFDTPFPYSNEYSHLQNVFSHKQIHSDVFVASGMYSIVNKFQFSHTKLSFEKEIDERISLTLLYKETEIFKGT